ncbi:LOW QUALITY PROTEIN: yeti [Dermatophagoides pteronyssinus]|uniref:LOW QUALITY PROTEIN: yeti n=1 Tax=Dermatophagoides pteronyssinus TaxID=6956 RepID=UPI003F677083
MSAKKPEDHERYLNNDNEDDDDDDEDDEDYLPNDDNHNDDDAGPTSGEDSDVTDQEADDDNDNADDIPAKKTAEDVKIDTNKLDELWNDFCSDQSSTAAKSDDKKSAESPKKVTTMTKQYDFAGEIVLIKETVDASSVAKTPNVDQQSSSTTSAAAENGNSNQGIKRSGGLSGLLTQLKKPKISTLKKSLHDWTEYKESNRLDDELDQHRRSKGSFLERQAFLSRTDVRQFEQEKSVRDRQRKLRDLKQQPK